MKRIALSAIKDSPPYLHDGRCLTLEYFNIVFHLKLNSQEKKGSGCFYAPAVAKREA
jgi:hypothetical protein